MAQPPSSTNSTPITTTTDKSPCKESSKKEVQSPSTTTTTSPSSSTTPVVATSGSATSTSTYTTIYCPWTGRTILKPVPKERPAFVKEAYNYCEICQNEEVGIVQGHMQLVAWCTCSDDEGGFLFN